MVLLLLLANAGGEPQQIWQPGHLQRLRDASSPFPTPTFLKPRARHIAVWDRTERCSRQLWWLPLPLSARPTTVSRHPRTHQKHTSTSKQPPSVQRCLAVEKRRGLHLCESWTNICGCFSSVFHYCSFLTILPPLIKPE